MRIKLAVITLLILAFSINAMMVTSARMAYVDVERVFDEINEIKLARKKMKSLIDEKKRAIEDTEHAIASVRNKISGGITVPVQVSEQKPAESLEDNSEDSTKQEDQVIDEKEESSKQADELSVSEKEENVSEDEVIYEMDKNVLKEPEVSKEKEQKKIVLPPFEIEEMNKMLNKKEEELKNLMETSKKLIEGKGKEFKYKIFSKIYEAIKNIADNNDYTVIVDKEMILFAKKSVIDITDEVIRSLNEEYK